MPRRFSWFILLGMFAPLAGADPFPSRDQNPFAALFGLPGPLPSRIFGDSGWTVSMDLQWANTSSMQDSESEVLVVDGEQQEVRFAVARALGERWQIRAQLPYRRTEAGSLDSFIDDWHGWFGLPDGTRDDMPRDRLQISYARNGAQRLDVSTARDGIGDATLDIGYALSESPSAAAMVWLSIKAPTGDADDLTGSGSADAALAIAGERKLSERWSAFGQAGIAYLGEGDVLSDQQRSVVWSGMGGVSWRAFHGLSLKAQLDAHTALFDDSDLDFFGDTVMLTVGGDYRFANGWVLDLGVGEDVAVETTADVVFLVSIRSAW